MGLQYPALAEFRRVVENNAAERNKPKPQPTKYEKRPPKYDTEWSDERVKLLKRLRGEGLSFNQIADKIGQVTRNAVIGKAHRLGLIGKAHRLGLYKRATNSRKPAKPRARAIILKPVIAPRPAQILVPVLDENPTGGYKLTDLTERMCHWPNGDPVLPGFSFCGVPKEFGTPYCPHHSHIAHRKQVRKPKNKGWAVGANGFYWLDLKGRNERAAIAKAGA